ncbi:MAG: diguanylate cyclase, partial [Solirubrobacterales bacterium]|nr:diguanylate cyclase [Solirubrobacterales bacterium]
MGALLLGYVILLLGGYSPSNTSLIGGWGVDAFEMLAGALCVANGFVRRRGRAVPIVLGASLMSWATGDLVLTLESLGGGQPPTPSLSDVFWLGFFPLAYVAVVLLIRAEVRRLATPHWLDGAVAGMGAASVCAAFAFKAVMRATGGDGLGTAVNLAYPVGDVFLLLLVVGGTALLSGKDRGPWLLVALGITLNVVGDTSNLFQASFGHVGSLFNAFAWPASILLMSMAMWLRTTQPTALAEPRPSGYLLPGLTAIAGLVILVVGTVQHVDRIAVALAAGALMVVGIRTASSVRGLRALTEERRRLSVTDHLTGLGNRRYLFEVLDGFFAHRPAEDEPPQRMAFLYVDLDGFKEINDSFGHPAGDEVLRALGGRFRSALDHGDVLVRVGGDEFAALLMDADADHAVTVAKRLVASLEGPFRLEAVSAQLGASIGIALAPDDATDSASLMWCADVAMYRAKLGATACALYEQDLDDQGNRLRLADELRVAIEESQLVVHYQPQLDLRSGVVSTVEALVRWPHPSVGLIAPLKFLPLAEEAGLMGRVTRWVLTEALRQCATWRTSGREMSVSVNISASDLLAGGFVQLVKDVLEHHRLPADALVLEITETS